MEQVTSVLTQNNFTEVSEEMFAEVSEEIEISSEILTELSAEVFAEVSEEMFAELNNELEISIVSAILPFDSTIDNDIHSDEPFELLNNAFIDEE